MSVQSVMHRRSGDTIRTDRDTSGDVIRSGGDVSGRSASGEKNRRQHQSSRKRIHFTSDTDVSRSLSVQSFNERTSVMKSEMAASVVDHEHINR